MAVGFAGVWGGGGADNYCTCNTETASKHGVLHSTGMCHILYNMYRVSNYVVLNV